MVGEGKSFFSGWGHFDNKQGWVVILSSVTGTANVKLSLPVPVR